MQKTWTSDFQSIINCNPCGRVLALCLHPALDVTVYTDGGRQTDVREDLGGKAVNLARMLYLLGADVTLLAPSDPEGLTALYLRECGFACELVKTNLSLRRNYKYIDTSGRIYEQNTQAGCISPQHFTQLIDRVLHICRTRQISVLALCGSFPQGVEKDVYKSLIERAKALNITCVTDASKDALFLAVQAKPQLIKPNLQEFCALTEQDLSLLKTQNDVEKAVFAHARRLGVSILCSMDKDGAVFADGQILFTVKSQPVLQVAGFAGAGDTMLASYLFAKYLCNQSYEQSLRFASAAASAKVRLPANTLPCPDQIFDAWTHTQISGKAEHEIYQK